MVISPSNSTSTSSTSSSSSLIQPISFAVSYNRVREMNQGKYVNGFDLLDSYIVSVGHNILLSLLIITIIIDKANILLTTPIL